MRYSVLVYSNWYGTKIVFLLSVCLCVYIWVGGGGFVIVKGECVSDFLISWVVGVHVCSVVFSCGYGGGEGSLCLSRLHVL